MYEFRAGTGRLIDALDRTKEDPERMAQLASLLYYYEDQLTQDIKAAVDFYEAFRNTERRDTPDSL